MRLRTPRPRRHRRQRTRRRRRRRRRLPHRMNQKMKICRTNFQVIRCEKLKVFLHGQDHHALMIKQYTVGRSKNSTLAVARTSLSSSSMKTFPSPRTAISTSFPSPRTAKSTSVSPPRLAKPASITPPWMAKLSLRALKSSMLDDDADD